VNRSRRFGFLIAVFVLLAVFSSGCGGRKTPERLHFAVGGTSSELDFWEKKAREFERKTGTPVRVHRQPTDTDLRRQELLVAMTSKRSDPDVTLLDVAWLPQFSESGWLRPIPADGVEETAFFDRVLDLVDRKQDRLIALPVYLDGGILYYRRDLLEKYGYAGPPETWDELVQMARAVQEGERRTNPDFFGFVWQGAQYEGLVCTFLEFAVSRGGGIQKARGDLSIDTEANREALRFMVDLVHRHRISPPNTFTEMKEEEVRLFFQAGNALFERNWPYAWALHQKDSSAVRGRTRTAPLPRSPSGRTASTLGGWHIAVSAFTDLPGPSLEFLRFVTSKEVQRSLVLEQGWNPGRKDLYRDPAVRENSPHVARLKPVFENAVARPALPYYPLLSEILQRRLNAALSGTLSPENALETADREIRTLVERYRS
jgi:multiple sugar transport system substrate-binding protein